MAIKQNIAALTLPSPSVSKYWNVFTIFFHRKRPFQESCSLPLLNTCPFTGEAGEPHNHALSSSQVRCRLSKRDLELTLSWHYISCTQQITLVKEMVWLISCTFYRFKYVKYWLAVAVPFKKGLFCVFPYLVCFRTAKASYKDVTVYEHNVNEQKV